MRRFSKDDLLRYLLIACIFLVSIAAFVLFFERGLHWLGNAVRFIGLLLSPFLIAWMVAVITRPLTQWLIRRLHFPPTLAVLVMLLLALALITAMIWLVIVVISNVLSNLSYYVSNMESYTDDLLVLLDRIYDRLGLDTTTVQSYIDQSQETVSKWASQGMSIIFNVAKSTPGFMVLLLVMLVATFYWCREEYRIRDVLIRAFPRRMQENLRKIYDNISGVLGGYVRAQALLVTISLVICILGFTILGVKSPLPMGLFAGVMDIIPILGPGTLLVPWAVWSLVSGKYVIGIGLLVIYAIVSVTRYILEPKIVGDRVGLHPLATLAAIFFGMKMFGIVGLILGPIVLALALVVWRTHRKNKKTEVPSDNKTTDEVPPRIME